RTSPKPWGNGAHARVLDRWPEKWRQPDHHSETEKHGGAVGLKSYFTLPWSLHRAVAYAAIQEGMAVRAHGWAREHSPTCAHRGTGLACAALHNPGRGGRGRDLSRRKSAVYRDPVQRARPGSRRRR